MRLVKKLGAVMAMSAVCLTMVAPTTASASTATESCAHSFIKQNPSTTYETFQHGYYVGLDEDGREIWNNCVINRKTYTYEERCRKCGIVETHTEITDTHSHCGL